ncbi:hypothetical protein HJ184_21100 [Vibrio parahaemolyticus]|nr:hypothetical protein [Vibrio parahaemolyticus]
MVKKSDTHQVTAAQAIRDVVIKAMDEGMLVPLALILWVTMILYKMSTDTMMNLFENVIELMAEGKLFGWFSALVILAAWGTQMYFYQKRHRQEIDEARKQATLAYNQKLRKAKVKV